MTSTLFPTDHEVERHAPPERDGWASPLLTRLTRVWRGADGDPAWARPALLAVAALAAVLFGWGLSRNGYGNDFYAAAVLSATKSWKAFLFGSLDPGNFITVDKPPLALWVMALSGRLFGFSSWSMLLPEALAGVASVLVLHRLVRRWAGHVPALLAAAAFALTPIVVAMFRVNNPDAVLTLLLLLGAWGVWSALETGRTRPLALAGAAVGAAFLAKMLQAFLVLPAFGLVYLLLGRPSLRRRIGQLAVFTATAVASAGWWVALAELWPASSRPYIGGSTNNSVLDLVLGYNGFARLFGGSGPGGGGGPGGGPGGGGPGGGGGFGGAAGWLRMFNEAVGSQVSWLLPLALVGLIAGLALTARRSRDDLGRAGYVLWGLWAVVHVAVFSFQQGIFHPYYTVALAPAVAALAATGATALWRAGRDTRWARWLLPAAVLGSAGWAYVLLSRTPTFAPWLRPAIVAAAVLAAAGLALRGAGRGRLAAVGAGLAAVAVLAGPAAYAATTVAGRQTGSIIAAGPAGASGQGPGRGFAPGGAPDDGRQDGLRSDGQDGSAPAQAFGGAAGVPDGAPYGGPDGPIAGGPGGPGGPDGSGGPDGPGGPGGPGDAGRQVDAALVSWLQAHRGTATWLVAVSGSQQADGLILSSGEPVMAMGGFSGGDPAPTAEDLAALVSQGRLRFVLLGGGGPGGRGFAGQGAGGAAPGPDDGAAAIGRAIGGGAGAGGPQDGSSVRSARDQWVTQNCTVATVPGAVTGASLYDCAPGSDQ